MNESLQNTSVRVALMLGADNSFTVVLSHPMWSPHWLNFTLSANGWKQETPIRGWRKPRAMLAQKSLWSRIVAVVKSGLWC